MEVSARVSSFGSSSRQWFTINEQAQKKHLQRVYAEPLSSILEVSDKEDTFSSASMNLSVPHKEFIHSYWVATSTLEDIWKKGIHLYSTQDHVTTVSGHSAGSNSQMVASLTSGEPHFITERSPVSFFAKAYVKGLVYYKICWHVVAAAESCGALQRFCSWWKSQKGLIDLDSLSQVGLTKDVAGQKGGDQNMAEGGKNQLPSILNKSLQLNKYLFLLV